MRIAPNVVTPPIAGNSRDAQPAKASDASTQSQAASVVQLSSAGASAAAGTAAATGSSSSSTSATTTTRLATIRAQLDKGKYPVDLDVLASRIVDDEFVRAGRS
jgi:anti-sigma28 factor (negative regulator of flagellin synthesis)